MSETISNRSEILFLYDTKDINPNGDPLDENKPRIDEETMQCLVTDVRLKRTIRDHLHDYLGEEIFIKEERLEDGTLKTKEERLDDLDIKTAEDLTGKCVDIRLFGATAAVKKKSIILTGPVQFRIGRSLHKVQLTFIKGTTVYPSGKEKDQGTFTEMYVLPYSLIGFYGVVNENAAKHTGLKNSDVELLMDGLWNGTKNLISRSKVGQMPRLLMKVNYSEKNYHIGDLDGLLQLKTEKREEEIRGTEDYVIEVKALVDSLVANKEKITSIDLAYDQRLTLVHDGAQVTLTDELKKRGFRVSPLKF